MASFRRTEYPGLNPLFLERWSPRSFSTTPLSTEEIETLFEAARWAPSCYNEQPWMFCYSATSGEKDRFLELLTEKNQAWARFAPVLAFAFARKRFKRNGKPNRWAEFDTGAAWVSLAYQAHLMGLATHAMAGFDEARCYETLGVPREDYVAVAAIAIGRPGNPTSLPPDLRERESPSGREPLDTFLHRGRFNRADKP